MNNYLPLKSRSAKLGDQYYRCLSDSLTGPDTKETLEECLRIGRQYRSALRAQLKDLKRFPDGGFVKRESELASSYLNLIEHDLESLSHGDFAKLRKRRPPKLDQ